MRDILKVCFSFFQLSELHELSQCSRYIRYQIQEYISPQEWTDLCVLCHNDWNFTPRDPPSFLDTDMEDEIVRRYLQLLPLVQGPVMCATCTTKPWTTGPLHILFMNAACPWCVVHNGRYWTQIEYFDT